MDDDVDDDMDDDMDDRLSVPAECEVMGRPGPVIGPWR